MATFKLKEDEYLNYYKFTYGSKKNKLIWFWIIFSIIIILTFYFGQYLFAGFLVIAALILTYLNKIKYTEEFRYKNNPFLNNTVNLELYEENYKIKVKENELNLSIKEVAKVEDLKDHYRIDHKCGNSLIIPKSCLDEKELKQMNKYKSKKPSKKWQVPMY